MQESLIKLLEMASGIPRTAVRAAAGEKRVRFAPSTYPSDVQAAKKRPTDVPAEKRVRFQSTIGEECGKDKEGATEGCKGPIEADRRQLRKRPLNQNLAESPLKCPTNSTDYWASASRNYKGASNRWRQQ